MTKFLRKVIHRGKVYFASHFQGFHSIAVWHWSFKGFPKARHNDRYSRKRMAVHGAGARKQGAGTFRV